MRIPEAIVCDALGCTRDAKYRISHELLPERSPVDITTIGDYRPVYVVPGRIVFTFCDQHAEGFAIGARGMWTTGDPLRPGSPEGL